MKNSNAIIFPSISFNFLSKSSNVTSFSGAVSPMLPDTTVRLWDWNYSIEYCYLLCSSCNINSKIAGKIFKAVIFKKDTEIYSSHSFMENVFWNVKTSPYKVFGCLFYHVNLLLIKEFRNNFFGSLKTLVFEKFFILINLNNIYGC
jgi:hypothetical protein